MHHWSLHHAAPTNPIDKKTVKPFFFADTEVPVGETDEKVLTRSSNPGQKQPTVITGKRWDSFQMTLTVTISLFQGWFSNTWPPWRSRGSTTARGTRRESCARSSCPLPSSASPCAWPWFSLDLRKNRPWRWIPGSTQPRWSPHKVTKNISNVTLFIIFIFQGGESTLFFANDDKKSNWPQRYADSLLSQTGFSTKCIDGWGQMTVEKSSELISVDQGHPAAEHLRRQHVRGCRGRPPGVLTLPSKCHH